MRDEVSLAYINRLHLIDFEAECILISAPRISARIRALFREAKRIIFAIDVETQFSEPSTSVLGNERTELPHTRQPVNRESQGMQSDVNSNRYMRVARGIYHNDN